MKLRTVLSIVPIYALILGACLCYPSICRWLAVNGLGLTVADHSEHTMNHIMQEHAQAAGDHAVQSHGRKLDKMAQLKLWSQTHDAVLAALISYDEVMNARRVRAIAQASEN